MKIVSCKNYNEMSDIACGILINRLKEKPDALFCAATGSSPTGAYEKFIQRAREERLGLDRLRLIKLDEWIGLEHENPATCERYIQNNLIRPLGITEDRYISFNPKETNGETECARISKLLEESGGIDVCVLGLGKNGHLGLNEPGLELDPFIHKTALDPLTKTHSMLESNSAVVSEGYTLGIKNILDSRQIIFLVTGEGKKEAYKNFLCKKISGKYPANYLWLHNNVICIIDESSM